MNIAIYSRKSKFTGKGESIENQIELCKEYISHYLPHNSSYELFIYEDEGFSAKNTHRPKFQEMLRDIDRYRFSYIVCYRLDRISRNVSDFSNLIEHLKDKNVAFICIREQFDTSTPMGRAMMYMASVFAQLERETIAERIRDNMLMLARTGRWLGGNTPAGFTSIKAETISADKKTKTSFHLAPTEDASMIQFIYSQFLDFHSLKQLSDTLSSMGLLTKRGHTFTSVALREILQNPVYCAADEAAQRYFMDIGCQCYISPEDWDGRYGIAAYNKNAFGERGRKKRKTNEWIIAIGQHSALIPGKDWVAVQTILKTNTKSGPRKIRSPYSLLSGSLYCQNCRTLMRPKSYSSRHWENGEIVFYYICEKKEKNKCCNCSCPNLHGNLADTLVLNKIISFCTIKHLADSLIIKCNPPVKESLYIPSQLKLEIQKNLKIIQGIQQTLSENNELHIKEYLKEQITLLENKTEQLQTALQSTVSTSTELEVNFPFDLDLKNILGYLQKTMTVHEKRDFIKTLVQRMEWDGSELEIYLS